MKTSSSPSSASFCSVDEDVVEPAEQRADQGSVIQGFPPSGPLQEPPWARFWTEQEGWLHFRLLLSSDPDPSPVQSWVVSSEASELILRPTLHCLLLIRDQVAMVTGGKSNMALLCGIQKRSQPIGTYPPSYRFCFCQDLLPLTRGPNHQLPVRSGSRRPLLVALKTPQRPKEILSQRRTLEGHVLEETDKRSACLL